MKSIIYLLIAVFTFSIIAASIPNKTIRVKIINIEAVDANISKADLDASANILNNRMKTFCTEGFDLKVITEKNQIQVKVPDNLNIEIIARLLTEKGKLGFYETYNIEEVSAILKDDKLNKLLNGSAKGFELGCVNIKNTESVVEYLKSVSQSQCKFVWGTVNSGSEACLYALKSDNEGKSILSGADIEKSSVKISEYKGHNDVAFSFKDLAVKTWAETTKRNIGRAIAIELDNVVVCAPIVNNEINKGMCMISGDFSKSEAALLVSILQSGELPVDFKIVK